MIFGTFISLYLTLANFIAIFWISLPSLESKLLPNPISERKFSAVQLCILSQNTPAKALYQSLGFVETGEYDEDEIILRLEF